jgi:hypothetical protein
VCAQDTFCCDVAWDGLCADAALTDCPGLCQDVADLDDFLCYKVKAEEKFEEQVVRLDDQFDTEKFFDVKKPERLCNPADKNGGGINTPEAHLKGYQIKLAKTSPPQLKHETRTNILVENQFGKIFVDTSKPDRLLVPTAKDPDKPLDELDPVPIDHFKCYKVKVKKNICEDNPNIGCKTDDDCTDAAAAGPCSLGFPKDLQAQVADQFTDPAKLFDLKKPSRLCTPVDKNLEGIKDPVTHLMCYQVKPVKKVCASGAPQNKNGACKKEEDCGGTKDETGFCIEQPKHKGRIGIHVNNQFGAEILETKKEDELCVPSSKTLPDL